MDAVDPRTRHKVSLNPVALGAKSYVFFCRACLVCAQRKQTGESYLKYFCRMRSWYWRSRLARPRCSRMM